MHIKTVTVSNFENLEGEYQLHPHTVIRGRNGAGKSAIGRAIAWAITGRDITGDKRTDHMVRDLRIPMWVQIETSDGRTYLRKKTRTTTSLKIDGNAAPAAGDCGDTDTWLASFWPGYFQTLDDADKRRLFMAALPNADAERQRLYRDRTGTDLPQDYDPIRTHKAASARRLQAERQHSMAQGAAEAEHNRVNEIGTRLRNAKEQGPDRSRDLEIMRADAARLREEAYNEQKVVDRHQAWEAEKAKIEEDRAHNQRVEEERKAAMPDLPKLDAELEKIRDLLNAEYAKNDSYCAWAKAAEEYRNVVEHNKRVEAMQAKARKDLLACPLCESEIPDDHSGDAMRSRIIEADDSLPGTVSVPKAPGPEPERPDDGLIVELQSRLRTVQEYRADAGRRAAQLKALALREIPDMAQEPTPGDPNKIKRLQLMAEKTETEIRDIEAQARAQDSVSADELKRAQEAHAAAIELVAEAAKETELAAAAEEAVHPTRGIEQDALAWQIKQAFHGRDGEHVLGNLVEFVLTETTKTTGEERPCFRIDVKIANPQDRGAFYPVPLAYTSAGQQLWIQCQIAEFLDQAQGRTCGMRWLDNADLLSTDIPAGPGVQLIEARVSRDTAEPKIINAGDREWPDAPRGTIPGPLV